MRSVDEPGYSCDTATGFKRKSYFRFGPGEHGRFGGSHYKRGDRTGFSSNSSSSSSSGADSECQYIRAESSPGASTARLCYSKCSGMP